MGGGGREGGREREREGERNALVKYQPKSSSNIFLV